MTPRTRLSLRLALFYAAIFSVIGVQLPFWPLYLTAKGITPTQLGEIMAGAYLIKIVTNPLVGQAVDGWGNRRIPLVILASLAILTTSLFAWTDSFTGVLLVTLASSAAFTAMMPLGESLTVLCAATYRVDYGRIRLWGSLTFILSAGLSGIFLVDAPRPTILWSCVAGQILTLAAVWQLPDIRPPRLTGVRPALGTLVRTPAFLLFLAATSLGHVSHMIYYGFATLHWKAAGLSGGMIGGLWAEGVIAEVVLFAFGARLVDRFGPGRMIIAGGVAGVIRWTVLAVTTDPLPLAVAQLLHAFTFGAMHLGAMHFIGKAIPASLSARAQGLYSAITMGVVPGCAMLVAGRLYQDLEGGSFLVMSGLAGLGTLLALLLMRRWQGGDIIRPLPTAAAP